MRQHTSVLVKPIKKLKQEETKKKQHISSKLTKSLKTNKKGSKNRDRSRSTTPDISEEEENHKFLRNHNDYHKIQEMVVYEPTKKEFAEPFLLIKNLSKKGYDKYGAVKIKAPEDWSDQFSFNPGDKTFSTRKQPLKDLIRGKAFDYKHDAYTLDEFKEYADNFAKGYNYIAPFHFSNIYRNNEYEYWAHVEDPQYKKANVTVEYAADLPSRKYGSGFPTVPHGRMTDELDPDSLETHQLNMNNLVQARDSLFQVITTKTENISGISSPWMYVGMLFASFCWHVEDLYMHSVNYMHKGAPKTWYVVPAEYKEKLDDCIKEKYGELFILEPGLMYNITQTMNPLELVKRNVPVYRTEQKPGEFIITFPKAYHAGFSHGFNVAEAVNIAAPEWIPYARSAMEDYATDSHHKHASFPWEWLVIENMQKIDDLEFTPAAKKTLQEEYRKLIDKEIADRDNVKNIYDRLQVKKFQNPNMRYDTNICSTCKNYCYLSYLCCSKCNKKVCTHHISTCVCLNANITLHIRFTDEELDKLAPRPRKNSKSSSMKLE